MAQQGIINENVRQMQEMVLEAMDKYPFIEEYLIQPDVNTGVRMPLLIKYITTILYLRRRMGFLVEPEESFYDSIERNDYAQFEEISDKMELYTVLVCFVTLACGYVNSTVDDIESRDRIVNTIRKYYYRNKDFVAECIC